MKLWSRLALAVAGSALLWVGFTFVVEAQGPRMATPTMGIKSSQYFKNVTTSTLKDLTPDDFLSAMSVITDDLGFDCADCHPGAGSDKADFVSDAYPTKKKARQMIEMMAAINKTNFSGVQMVTCYTCHHGRDVPVTSIPLDRVYSGPPPEDDDVVPAAIKGAPTADEILNNYLQAMGGTQRLNAITSYVSTGTALGYGGFGGDADFAMYAKSPNQKTIEIFYKEHPDRGVSRWSFDGRAGWIRIPRALFEEYPLQGGELNGARFEAQLAFPGQLKSTLSNWRAGLNRVIDDKAYLVVQGSGPAGTGLLGTFYFDQDTKLLKRMVRMVPSPVGRVSVQIDYADYRDVNGVKFPFEYGFTWMGGRYTAKIKDVKTNVAIDAAKFAKP
jgi:hypothetical protein